MGPEEGQGAVGVGAADRQAVEVRSGLVDLLGGSRQSGLRGGRVDAQVLEDVGAVVQRADAHEERRAVDLAADGHGLLRRGVGVLGLVPCGVLGADVGEAAVPHVSGGVGVAVLDEVGGARGVVERRLDALRAGVDGDVLDLDVGPLVPLLEGGDGRVDGLLLGRVADLTEQPDAQRSALLVRRPAAPRGLGCAGGGAETGEDKCGQRSGYSGERLHRYPYGSSVAIYAMNVSLCTTGVEHKGVRRAGTRSAPMRDPRQAGCAGVNIGQTELRRLS